MGKRSVGVSVATKASIEIAFTFKGRSCRERVKLAPTRENLTYCRRWRQGIQHEIAAGTFVYRRHFPHSPRAAWFGERGGQVPTLGQLLDRWFIVVSTRTYKPLSKAGLMSYESAIRVHWRPRLGALPIDSPSVADQVRQVLIESGVSTKTQNNLLTPVRGAYDMAFEEELIDKNPLDRVRAASVERHEPDPFTVAEIRAILAASTEPQHRALFQFAFATGLRTSELIALIWGDVEWDKRVLHVRRAKVRGELKTPKTASGRRTVDLFVPAMTALAEQGRHGRYHTAPVFHDPETSRPWTDDAPIRRAWTAALERAGVRYRCPYQTRHTYASMMLSAGEDPTYIAAQMGHRDWAMIRKVYARWIPGVRADAGSKGAAALAALAGPLSPPLLRAGEG